MPFSARTGFFSGGVVANDFDFPTWNTAPSQADYLTEVGSWSNTSVATTTLISPGFSMNHRGVIGHPNGNLYMIPRNVQYFVEIDPVNDVYTQMTSHGVLGSNNYTGGAIGHNGNIYVAPFGSGQPIVEFDPVNDVASQLTLTGMPSSYSYYGAYTLPSGNILFQPRTTSGPYLKYTPGASSIEQLSESLTSDFGHSGGCVGFDGKFYACPQNQADFRVYNESGNSWTTFATSSLSGANRYTGFANGNDGKIVGVPHSQGYVCILDTTSNSLVEYSASQLGLNYTSTAYIGPTTGSDGKVYALPFNESDMLVVDTAANSYTQIATSGSSSFTIGAGATKEGYIYSARVNGSHFMRVDTNYDAVNSYGAPYTNSSSANTIFSAHISHSLNKGP
tara:strand:- start:559 stop:1734 length:1176 start_codon:yes stop_codon:yes gene_type:complete